MGSTSRHCIRKCIIGWSDPSDYLCTEPFKVLKEIRRFRWNSTRIREKVLSAPSEEQNFVHDTVEYLRIVMVFRYYFWCSFRGMCEKCNSFVIMTARSIRFVYQPNIACKKD